MIETATRGVRIENLDALIHITLLQDQVIVVITDKSLQLSNLHMTFQTKYEDFPTATCIKDDQGRPDESNVQSLARSLCKKNQVSVCLSYNLPPRNDPGYYLLVSKIVNEQLAEVLAAHKAVEAKKSETDKI